MRHYGGRTYGRHGFSGPIPWGLGETKAGRLDPFSFSFRETFEWWLPDASFVALFAEDFQGWVPAGDFYSIYTETFQEDWYAEGVFGAPMTMEDLSAGWFTDDPFLPAAFAETFEDGGW